MHKVSKKIIFWTPEPYGLQMTPIAAKSYWDITTSIPNVFLGCVARMAPPWTSFLVFRAPHAPPAAPDKSYDQATPGS